MFFEVHHSVALPLCLSSILESSSVVSLPLASYLASWAAHFPAVVGLGQVEGRQMLICFENSQAEVDHVLFQTWKSFGFTGHNNTSLLLVGIVLSFTATRANCNPIITAPAVTVSEYWNSSIVSQLR